MEIWKDIPGYDSIYQVSSLGNVRSRYYLGGGQRLLDDNQYRLLKTPISSAGYPVVNLPGLDDRNKRQVQHVHRLIGVTFLSLENFKDRKQVNHINGIKTDNHIDNLEICTASENMKHAYKNGLTKKPPSAGSGSKYWRKNAENQHP